MYNVTTIFSIQRNARACKRIFTRNVLKCEVWAKKWVYWNICPMLVLLRLLSSVPWQCWPSHWFRYNTIFKIFQQCNYLLIIYLNWGLFASDFEACVAIICNSSPCCCFSMIFRSDTLIGTVNVKLQPLETQCTIHDAYNVSI